MFIKICVQATVKVLNDNHLYLTSVTLDVKAGYHELVFIRIRVGEEMKRKKLQMFGQRYTRHMKVEDQQAGFLSTSCLPLNRGLDISFVAACNFRSTSLLRWRKLLSFQIFRFPWKLLNILKYSYKAEHNKSKEQGDILTEFVYAEHFWGQSYQLRCSPFLHNTFYWAGKERWHDGGGWNAGDWGIRRQGSDVQRQEGGAGQRQGVGGVQGWGSGVKLIISRGITRLNLIYILFKFYWLTWKFRHDPWRECRGHSETKNDIHSKYIRMKRIYSLILILTPIRSKDYFPYPMVTWQ